jgi:hypothetical protein
VVGVVCICRVRDLVCTSGQSRGGHWDIDIIDDARLGSRGDTLSRDRNGSSDDAFSDHDFG